VRLELSRGVAATINSDGTVSPLIITQSGPASIAFGLDGVNVELEGSSALTGGGLTLEVGGTGIGRVSEFFPGTVVSIWIFSEPVELDSAIVGADGTVAISFDLPGDLPIGGHSLQIQGIGHDSQPRALATGVSVERTVAALPMTGGNASNFLVIGGGFLLVGCGGVYLSRRGRRIQLVKAPKGQ
jgi:LPXTG-motif cell wall-anchored protein